MLYSEFVVILQKKGIDMDNWTLAIGYWQLTANSQRLTADYLISKGVPEEHGQLAIGFWPLAANS